ncbi:MAG: lipid-A-disaccharide synthase [Candidatus Marinimicrobia bacterium]|nr:lipid-A-disaccharide synthase [Candidatus Neomarinimicrobiota bacterium]
MNNSAKRIMIVTGESSGDLHGANLIKAVKALSAETSFLGVGGRKMAAAGCDILIPSEKLAVMGLVEVIGHLPVIWRSFQQLKGELNASPKPDALVLIDFPDFNLRLAHQAKKAGVPVLYYISPKVWAWRKGRVKKIAENVDSLAVIFPFEPLLYDGLDILVKYVGHPLLDEFATAAEGVDLRQELEIPTTKKMVGLFPGSRHSELRYMLETLAGSAQLIHDRFPEVHFLVPIANSLTKDEVKSQFPFDLPISYIESGITESDRATIYAVAGSCDTILTVSGTVTLQIALVGTPMAIFYKASTLTYEIGKRLVKIDHFGLPNIVVGRRVAPEFLQEMATPQALADEALRVLSDADYAESMRDGLRKVQGELGEPGCSSRVAEMLLDMLALKSLTKVDI